MARTATTQPKREHVDPPKLIERHRLLLALLRALGGQSKNLDFQKLLFLFCQEPGQADLYDFVPYKFGAFSFTSYFDRRRLTERGYLASDEHQWCLSEQGRKAVGDTPDLLIASFVSQLANLKGDALVADTYRRYASILSHFAGSKS
jgi:hypothetical protein